MKKRWMGALLGVMLLVTPAAAWGFGAVAGQNVTVAKGETRTGTYYAAGQTVTIAGTVDGDVVCAGETVTISGPVHGDVVCAGQTVSVTGPVDGSVRVAGQTVEIGGAVGRNATVAAQTLNVGSGAHVAGDLGAVAQSVSVNGPVDGGVHGGMQDLTLAAAVGPVAARVQTLALHSGAHVNGDLRYTSARAATVDPTLVSGTVAHTVARADRGERARQSAVAWLVRRLYWAATALLVGLVLVFAAPRLVAAVSRTLRERPGASLGCGTLVVVAGVLEIIVLMLTIVGIPLALLAAAVLGVVLATSSVFAGVAAGQWLLARAGWRRDSLAWAAAVGIPLCAIGFGVPVLGAVLAVAAGLWVVGGVAQVAARAVR